jgi:phosphatidate cytidylyltransferase
MSAVDLSGLALPPVAVDLVALALLAGLGIGLLLLCAGSLAPATAARARPLWPVFLTEIVIVAGGLLPVLAGGRVLDVALFLFAFRITREAVGVALHRLPGGRTGAPRHAVVPAALAVAALSLALSRMPLSGLVLAGGGVVLLAVFVRRGVAAKEAAAGIAAELVAFPLVPLVFFVAAARQEGLAGLLLLAFLLVETYDSYALLGGKLFGRRLAFPRLSPRKTVEGLAAGGIMLALTSLLLGPFVFGWSPLMSLLVAVLIAVAAVVGDLAGSRLKRASGVKDYPQVLPRQGGLLDIADAWLIAGPLLVFLGSLGAAGQG